ncbi:MAG: thioredoxin family protein [Bacteroidetes bacterium]|nr:thioredoxin family protein [Bacteroidota bacterium]
MMRKFAALALFVISTTVVFAQNNAVVKLIMPFNGLYYNLSDVIVYRMENGQLLMNMSVRTFGEETFINIPLNNNEPEMVRILYNTKDGKYFDMIIPDGDTTVVQMEVYQTEANEPNIIKGNINKGFYEFLTKKKLYTEKNEELAEQYSNAKSKSEGKLILTKIEENRKQFEEVCVKISNSNKSNILGAYIRSNPVRKINYKLTEDKRKKTLISEFWDGINLSDIRLLKTFLFRDLLEEYISLYYDEHLLPSSQDSALIVGVNKAMDMFSQSEEHRNFAYNFLINGFETLQNSELVSYIVVHYAAPEQCDTEEPNTGRISEVEANERMRPGKPAPEIALQNEDGSPLSIRNIDADTVLVIFFSSTCSHCTKAMPQVLNLINKTKIKVVAVSADRDKNEYENYIKKYPDWIHYCDFKAGESKPIIDYNIKGTPTFILLDKERRIIDKFRTVEQLKQSLLTK